MKTAWTVIDVFTARPQGERVYWQAYPYRNIVGIDTGNGPLWLPGDSREWATEGLIVTPEFADKLESVFKHITEDNNKSSHVCAAMVNDYSDATNIDAAHSHAATVMLEGRRVTLPRLELGQHGVYGWIKDEKAYPIRSIVGLGNHPEAMQVDERGGRLSIVPYGELHPHVGLFMRETEVQ